MMATMMHGAHTFYFAWLYPRDSKTLQAPSSPKTMRLLRIHYRYHHQETILLLALAVVISTAIRIDPLEALEKRRAKNRPPPSRDLKKANKPIANVPVDVPTHPDGHLVVTESLPLWRAAATTDDNDESSQTLQQWAGHLPVSADGDNYFFYWLFGPDTSSMDNTAEDDYDEKDIPLLLFLNGGPACSSMDGLFLENGPLRFETDENMNIYLTSNPHSWHKSPAYTLYIDQPVGTGLSFTTSRKYPTNDEEVNVDFYYFMMEFFQLHADKFVTDNNRVHRPVFFSGESHAGHYIPSMLNYILQQNDQSPKYHIPIAGGAIGNGWTDPYYQYAAAEAAYGHGMLDRPQVYAMDASEAQCQAEIARGNYAASVCYKLLDKVVAQSQGSSSKYRVSTYDARRTEKVGMPRLFPPGHRILETYLGLWPLKNEPGNIDMNALSRVLEVIHATAATAAGQQFQECTDPPYEALSGQDGKGVVPDVIAVLEHKDNVRLLFFNGMEDLICNHVGNEMFLMNMQWSGQQEWLAATRYAWTASSEKEGKVSGFMKEYKNLSFLKLLNAGHMVPMDLPQQSLEMMHTFMYGKSFDQSPQNIKPRDKEDSCSICPSATCDPCEECSASDTGESASSNSNSSASAPTLLPWVVATLSVLALVIVVIRSRTRKSIRNHDLVPAYDLELREGNYSDRDGRVIL